jgi:hypothetical protein
MDINDVKTGDTFLVKSNTFLSKAICAVMKKWGKKKGYNTSMIYSHAARFVWFAGELYLFGSVDNGYNPIVFNKHYNWDKDDFSIMRRNEELSIKEINQTKNYCMHLDTVSKTYQYWNFLQWVTLVYLGLNLFTKDKDGFTYCYESEMMCRKNLNSENYGDVHITDIYQLLYDKNYKIIYKSK